MVTNNEQKIYLPNNKLPKALICDVDGTIAEINGRSYYDYNKVSTDIPREEIISMIKSWSIANKLQIILCQEEMNVVEKIPSNGFKNIFTKTMNKI